MSHLLDNQDFVRAGSNNTNCKHQSTIRPPTFNFSLFEVCEILVPCVNVQFQLCAVLDLYLE